MVKKPKILLVLKMGADMGSLFSTHGQREFVIRLYLDYLQCQFYIRATQYFSVRNCEFTLILFEQHP